MECQDNLLGANSILPGLARAATIVGLIPNLAKLFTAARRVGVRIGTAIEAMNRGYTVIVPDDCVASDPPEYAETAMRYTMRNIAFVVPSRTITECWAVASALGNGTQRGSVGNA